MLDKLEVTIRSQEEWQVDDVVLVRENATSETTAIITTFLKMIGFVEGEF
jgi:hypothetical protein